jgi:hypothetical protein
VGAQRIVFGWLAAGLATAASAQQVQIQFAEPISITAAAGATQFDAYGRRFNLTLHDNDRLLKAVPEMRKAGPHGSRLLRGKLQDSPGSWVRLAYVGNALEGAIWDGRELYVVTSHQRISGSLSLPLQVPPGQTVIYRLSDTIDGLPAQFCGLAAPTMSRLDQPTALKQFQDVVSELRASALLAAPGEQLEIALVADSAFQLQYGADSTDQMLARLNTVDGIFAEQVGVLIVPTQMRLVPVGGDPFTTTNAEALLGQLADYRDDDAAISAPGLAHLMTGKNLDGDVAGIAYIDSLCERREGVSLSESSWDPFISAMIMAHELGHNFGARHDGVVGGACASTPQSFLMAPFVNFSAQFSQCSLDTMAPVIARARGVCVSTASYADVGVQLPASPFNVDTSTTFSLPVTVNSAGNAPASDVRLVITLPTQLTFQSAVLDGGSCTANGNVVNCALGDLAAGEQRPVELRLSGNVLGSFNLQARLSADNDYLVANNTASVQIGLQSAVDLGLVFTVPPGELYVGDAIDFTLDISSLRSQAAVGGTLAVNLGGIAIENITAGAHTCAISQFNTSGMNCQLADVASGTTTRIVVRGRPTWASYFYASASVNVTNDGEFGNNHRSAEVQVRPERQVLTRASTEDLRAVIGAAYDVTYTLTAAGRLPASGAQFLVDAPWTGVVESVTASAGTCAAPAPQTATICDFGDLAPGDTRTVVVRVRMNTAGSSLLAGRTTWMSGTMQQYSYAHTWVTSNLRIDAAADFGTVATVSEGQTGFGNFGFQSIGIDAAQNAVVTLDIPAPARLTSLSLMYSPPGWACVIVTPQQGRCSGSFSNPPGSPYGRAQFEFVSDTPVDAQATLTLTADSDGNAANNTVTAPLRVRPNIDVSVQATASNRIFNMGELGPVEVRVRTAQNPVPAVRLWVTPTNPDIELDSITVNGVNCPVTMAASGPFMQPGCDMGDLPAGSNLLVTVHYRALQADRQGQVQMRVSTAQDSNFGNDNAYVSYQTQQLTEVQLSVAQASVTAVNGSRLRFPLITVTNGAAIARNVIVDVPLPTFASLDTVSSTGFCSGTTTLQCSWSSLAPGGSATIDFYLTGTAVGTFTSNVLLRAGNDSNAGNNGSSVAVSFTAPAAPPPSGGSSSGGGGGGGGGGGAFEWLTLGALSLLLRRRMRATR